jgi:hypothetical protein
MGLFATVFPKLGRKTRNGLFFCLFAGKSGRARSVRLCMAAASPIAVIVFFVQDKRVAHNREIR